MIRSDQLGSRADHLARKHTCSARLVSILYPRRDSARSPRRCRLLWFVAIILLFPLRDFGQQSASSREGESLVKAVQDPVASLVSVPIQDNLNPNLGPLGRVQSVLNIQPVVPVRISRDWNLIARIITPLITQPNLSQKDQSTFGLGDVNPTFFLAPAAVHKVIWGVGPAIVMPTATSSVLGQGKWSLGPSVVALVQPEHWTIGALVNNVWSVGGQRARPAVNQMVFQHFINYNLDKGWYLGTSPVVTANWQASRGNRWVAPVGGGVGRVFRLGFQPINIQLMVFGNAVGPSVPPSSPWSLRWQVAFLYPKKEKQKPASPD